MNFTADQVERYARHLILREIGGAGQQALSGAKVLIIGVGGLGCPAAMYLSAAGVGTIGLLDDDRVSLSNLQRQILFANDDIGSAKTAVGAKKLSELNPDIELITHELRLSKQNASDLFAPYDIIVDGCDNFPTRFLVNQACHDLQKTLVSGAVGRFDGQVSAHISNPDKAQTHQQPTACYQCLVPKQPPGSETCEQVGVIGALTGIIGSIMALEVIKLATGTGQPLLGKLLLWDGLSSVSRTVKLPADPTCPICSSLV